MKTLFVCFVALLFAFFVGCQSSITDPVVNNSENILRAEDNENAVYKDVVTSYYTGFIKLEGMIFDPSHPPRNFAAISGDIKYVLDQNLEEQKPPSAAIKVKLYVNAELKSGCPKQDRPWTVSARSEEVVYKANPFQSTYNLVKSFKVCHTCCAPLNLVLKLQVTEKKVILVSTTLKKVSENAQKEELKIY